MIQANGQLPSPRTNSLNHELHHLEGDGGDDDVVECIVCGSCLKTLKSCNVDPANL